MLNIILIYLFTKLQGDQLNMAVFYSGTLKKVTCPVYTCSVAYILDKPLYVRYKKNTAKFNWSPCRSFCGAGYMMRFAIILFLGLMALNASGRPKLYLVETGVYKVPYNLIFFS